MTTGIRAGANSSETRLAFVEETAWGTTPSSPSFNNLRFTGETLNVDHENVTSDEIRADRNVSDLILVSSGASGGVDFEMTYGTLDTLLEGLLQGTWTTDELKNGTTPKSFSLEKTYELGTTDEFLRYTGMVPDTMSLNIEAGSIITGNMAFMGKGGSVASAAISGATYTDGNDNGVMSATNDFASLSLQGLSPTPKIRTISLNVANNLRAQRAVGNLDAVGVGSGRCVVTGSLEAYFESKALYQKYLDSASGGLQFTLGSVTGEKYTINLPKIKFTTGQVQTPGNDQDIMATMEFQALFDDSGSPANNASIIITRAVS